MRMCVGAYVLPVCEVRHLDTSGARTRSAAGRPQPFATGEEEVAASVTLFVGGAASAWVLELA
jgi:hypothetical protein